MKLWRSLLLVYSRLDVRLTVRRDLLVGRDSVEPRQNYAFAEGRAIKTERQRFHHIASEGEIADALDSFAGFPQLVFELTNGAAKIEPAVIKVNRALKSLTRESETRFWPSPDDIRSDLDHFASAGKYDSSFVFWPQRDLKNGTAVPCDAWGLGMAASEWSNGATYAAIANAPLAAWTNEVPGEVWLHEWLHGVCAHFADRGHVMPTRDADGAELHGYVRSSTGGWTDYYRDLMNGNVLENGKRSGIPTQAWS
jgi:hypothetical protein